MQGLIAEALAARALLSGADESSAEWLQAAGNLDRPHTLACRALLGEAAAAPGLDGPAALAERTRELLEKLENGGFATKATAAQTATLAPWQTRCCGGRWPKGTPAQPRCWTARGWPR